MKIPYKYYNIRVKKIQQNDYIYYRIQKSVEGKKLDIRGKTKQEVEDKYYKLLEEHFNNNLSNLNLKNMTVEEFFHYYLFEVVIPSKSIKNSTINVYERQYNKYVKNSLISNIKFSEMNKEKAQKYINTIAKTSIKVSYLKQIKLFFSTVFNYAVNEDIIVKNPFKGVKLPKEENAKPKDKLLSDEEINLILSNCKNDLLLVVIKIALSTGMRIGEILALTEKDFNFEECSISVNKTCYYSKDYESGKQKIQITSPKTKSSIRIAYFNKTLSKDFKKFIANQKQQYLSKGAKYNHSNPLFVNNKLKIVNYRTLSDSLNQLLQSIGINKTGFHMFRHSFGSKLYYNNIDIKTISEQLGHSNIGITSNIYVHLEKDKREKAVEVLDKYFNA